MYLNNAELAEFCKKFPSVPKKHALVKYKYNNSSYLTKTLRKEVMLRSRLRNKFLNVKAEESEQLYNT